MSGVGIINNLDFRCANPFTRIRRFYWDVDMRLTSRLSLYIRGSTVRNILVFEDVEAYVQEFHIVQIGNQMVSPAESRAWASRSPFQWRIVRPCTPLEKSWRSRTLPPPIPFPWAKDEQFVKDVAGYLAYHRTFSTKHEFGVYHG